VLRDGSPLLFNLELSYHFTGKGIKLSNLNALRGGVVCALSIEN
jgi:hypothetical protein